MNAVLQELGKKLAEQWVTLLVLPGLLLLGTVYVAAVLRQWHAVEIGRLANNSGVDARTLQGRGGVAVALAVVAILLLCAALGLLARACGMAVRLVWLGQWPWPLHATARACIRRRSRRWDEATRMLAREALADAPDEVRLDLATHRRNAIALAPPARPTWIGDRLAAVDPRIFAEYNLQLSVIWPRLWLVLPADARTEVRACYDAFDASARLAGWGLLYLVVGAVWWPAALVGSGTLLSAWWRGRGAAAGLADLLESVVDLYAIDLARKLGVADEATRLGPSVGKLLTDIVRKGS